MENLHLCLNGSATASPKLQIRRSVRSSGQSLPRQSPQLASLQLPLILWSFLRPLRSPLSLSPQPPLSLSAFLFRRTLQVQPLSLSLIFLASKHVLNIIVCLFCFYRVDDLCIEGLERCYLLDFLGPKGFAVEFARRDLCE